MKKHIFYFIFVISLFSAGILSAQVPYNLKPGKPFAGQTIKVLSVVTPQFEGLALRDKEFTKLTGIKVEWTNIPFGSLQEKVASVGVAANGNFDVVNYLDSWGPGYSHWLVPINDLLKRDGISMDRYPPAFAKSASFENKVLGFPLRAHAQLMFYRKDLFKKHGLSAPKTWEDVIRAGKILQAKEKIGGLACYYGTDGNKQNLFIWLNFLWANGGKVFDKKMQPAWTSKKALEATDAYIRLNTKEKICGTGATSNLEQDARIQFAQGKAAMLPTWWWAYSPVTNPKSSVLNKDQVGFVGMPTYKGKVVTYAISMPFSISKYSKHQGAAWEFLKWLSNPELEKKNATEREVEGKSIVNNVVTHTRNLQDKEINQANANIQTAAFASLKNSDIMPQIKEWPEIGDLLSNAIQAAANGANTEKEMKAAAKKAKRILRRAGY